VPNAVYKNMWDMDLLRSDVANALSTPNKPQKEEDMKLVTPFRASDTRQWPGTPLTGGKKYRFSIGDKIPADAVGVMATLTPVDQAGNGWISVAAPDGALGSTTCNNYQPNVAVANTTVIPLRNRQFDIMSLVNAHVVIDVIGYYR